MFWPFVVCLTGISTLAKSPTQASDYLQPLLSFAAAHVPKNKHKETPLYILCTAGMRLLSERCTDVAFHHVFPNDVQHAGFTSGLSSLVYLCSEQSAILEDLITDLPLEFEFLFSSSHAEVISGKQEGERNLTLGFCYCC